MRGDVELMWQAMKSSHYRRIVEQLADTVRETDDFQKAISAALGTVIKAMHAETGTLWLYERFGSGRIHPKAVYGGADLSDTSLSPGEGIAGQVVEAGTSVIIRDCQKDKRWASRVDSKTGFQTRTMICVPLSWKKQTFGCIQIINQREGLFFDQKDLTFAENLAGEIASLLQEKQMLRDYITLSPETASKTKKTGGSISFQQLFCQGTERDLERQLRGMQEYADLTTREQREVLRLCKQLYGYFN